MKKLILSIAVLVATSSVAFAAHTHNSDDKEKSEKKIEMQKRGPEKRHANKGRAIAPNLFEGIELTDQQKEQINQLDASLAAERPVRPKAEDLDKLTEEQKKEMRKEARGGNKQGSMKKYLEGLKKILTPEQYVKFLENSYINQNGTGKAQGKLPHKKPQMKGNKDAKAQKVASIEKKAAPKDKK